MDRNIKNISCNNRTAEEGMPNTDTIKTLGGIRKIMAGVHDCLEALGWEDGQDRIVLATTPGEGIRLASLDEARGIIPCFGLYACEEETGIPGVSIAYDPDRLLSIGGEDYATGPVILFRYDEDGEYDSVTLQDAYDAQGMADGMAVTLCADGKEFPAFRLD